MRLSAILLAIALFAPNAVLAHEDEGGYYAFVDGNNSSHADDENKGGYYSFTTCDNTRATREDQTDGGYYGTIGRLETVDAASGGGGYYDWGVSNRTAESSRAASIRKIASAPPVPVPVRPKAIRSHNKLPQPAKPVRLAALTQKAKGPWPTLLKVASADIALPTIVNHPISDAAPMAPQARSVVALAPVVPAKLPIAAGEPNATPVLAPAATVALDSGSATAATAQQASNINSRATEEVAAVAATPPPVETAPARRRGHKPLIASLQVSAQVAPAPVARPIVAAHAAHGPVLASVRISKDAEANLDPDKAINLQFGDLILCANEDTMVRTGNAAITVAKGAIAFVSNRDECIKVRSLCDNKPDSVEVVVSNKKIALSVGQELVTARKLDMLSEAVSADSVARRNLTSYEVAGGDSFLVCEYSPITLIRSCQLLRTVSDGITTRDKQVFDRVLKMAACIQIATAGHGAYEPVAK